ncbi:MAG: ATPase domain-containing protein, partial [Nitrososphaerota archaeon]
MSRLGCTTILIKEELESEGGYSFEDYVADALICLKTARFEDKLLREVTFVKTRGSEIRSPNVCATLHQGFKLLPRQRVPKPPISPRF